MEDINTTLISIILPLIGAGIGYMTKHYIEKRKEIQSEVTKERRTLYQQFINLVIDLFSGIKAGNDIEDSKTLTQLYEFYKKYILYASPEVILDFSDFFQIIYKENSGKIPVNHFDKIKKLTKIMGIGN